MLFGSELGHNGKKAIEQYFCCAKDERIVDHSAVRR